MVNIVNSIVIRRPIAEVFDFVTTPTNWGKIMPEMGPEMVSPPDHPTRAGETFIENTPMKTQMLWTVKESTRPIRWIGVGVSKPNKIFDLGEFTQTWELAEVGGGTRVELGFSYTPGGFLGKLVIYGAEHAQFSETRGYEFKKHFRARKT